MRETLTAIGSLLAAMLVACVLLKLYTLIPAPTLFLPEWKRKYLSGDWFKMKARGIIFLVRAKEDQGDTYLEYQCPDCHEVLTEGPRGGAAVNAVCDKCRINYGCLPGFDFPINLGYFSCDNEIEV